MTCLLLAAAVLGLGLGTDTRAAQPLPVRPARPADDVAHKAALSEFWQVLAFDHASRTWVRIQFAAKPWTDFEITFRRGSDITRALGSSGMAIVPQRTPGLSLVEDSPIDPSSPPTASLSYTGGAYVVRVRFPTTRADLRIVPVRAGVTVGPWRLGREQVSWNPPAFVPGRRTWSVPVATGTATGSVVIDGHRLTLRHWRAYHDHTWGSFRLSSTSWSHSDFAVTTPRAGEAWILNGLEPVYDVKPHDRRWRGILVHASRSGVTTCFPRIARSGWVPYPNHADGWQYWLPSRIRARCSGGRSFGTRPESTPWGLGGYFQAQLGSSPTPGRTGWIEHMTPPVPNA